MLRDVLIQKGLSNREAEVGELVSKGLSNKEVANQLFVTEKTVKFHLTNIYKKMNVKSRAQLIVWCLPHLGFIESEPKSESTVVTPQALANGAAIVAAPAANATTILPQNNAQTIPAGSSTVTTLPGANNGIGRNNGGDVGAMGY